MRKGRGVQSDSELIWWVCKCCEVCMTNVSCRDVRFAMTSVSPKLRSRANIRGHSIASLILVVCVVDSISDVCLGEDRLTDINWNKDDGCARQNHCGARDEDGAHTYIHTYMLGPARWQTFIYG